MNKEELLELKKELKPSEERIWEKYYTEKGKNFKYPKENIYDVVFEENRNRKDYIALEYEGNSIRYGDFFDKVDQRTEFFKSKNVTDNDIVTIASLLTPDFVYDFYALGRLNAISNLIDPRTSVEGIKDYIKEADSKLVISNDLFLDKIKDLMDSENFEVIVNSLFSNSKNLEYPLNMVSLLTGIKSKLMQIKDNRYINYTDNKELSGSLNSKNEDLTIVHTGGTTGTPKSVVLTHNDYNAMAMQFLSSNIGMSPKEKFMIIMPPWIAYGSGLVHTSLVGGMTAQLLPKLDGKKMDEALIKYKPTYSAGVPSHFLNIYEKDIAKKDSFASTKAAAVGGGAMPAQLYTKVNDYLLEHGFSKGMIPGYGLTESSAAFALKQTDDFKPGSVGIPLPGGTVGIFKFDESTGKTIDEELGYSELGEVCLRTPAMMKGYYKNQELTDKVLVKHNDGNIWIHTGDLGYIDEDGFLFINGRIKELIIRYDGFKIYPNYIENVVLKIPEVENVKVVGITDNINVCGEIPKVFFTIKDDFVQNKEAIIDKIKKLCESELSDYYLEGISFEHVDKMPLTPMGKIDYRKLKEIGSNENVKVLKKSK